MTLYQMNLLLVQDNTKEGNLFLQSTVYAPRIDFRAGEVKITAPKPGGNATVDIYIVQDATLPSIDELVCINPIVHWIELGNIVKVSKKGKLKPEITVNLRATDPKGNTKDVETKVVNTTSSGGDLP